MICFKCYENMKDKYTSIGSVAYCTKCLLKMSKCTKCDRYFNGKVDICGPCYMS